MISCRYHIDDATTCAVRNAVVLGVSASVMGWWWSGDLSIGQP